MTVIAAMTAFPICFRLSTMVSSGEPNHPGSSPIQPIRTWKAAPCHPHESPFSYDIPSDVPGCGNLWSQDLFLSDISSVQMGESILFISIRPVGYHKCRYCYPFLLQSATWMYRMQNSLLPILSLAKTVQRSAQSCPQSFLY